MKSLNDIKQIVKKTKVKPTSEMRSKVLDEALQMQRDRNPQSTSDTHTWRIIMQSKMMKLTTVAAVILVIALGITFLDRSVSPAYAIEQTIEAMRSVSSIHAYYTDWDGSSAETWVQINPETGQEEYYHADQGNLLIVATPQVTYYYHKDKNLVRIKKEYKPTSEISFSRIFEDLPKFVHEHNGKYEFYNEFDEGLEKEVIIIHVEIPAFEKELNVRIDPQTKLPISIEVVKSRSGQGVKSVDNIEYNLPIPEGIFEFEIPEGAKVVYE